MKGLFQEFGWAGISHPPDHDLGTDLWVSPRDERRFDLGVMLGVQIKNGATFFREYRTVDGRAGWWHRNDQEHFDYWSKHSIPHIIVLRNPTTGSAYWAHVTPSAVVPAGKRCKLFVPEDQLIDGNALDALTRVAATARLQPRWSGSAWSGAPDLSRLDRLRYALLVPRLVAPHPNVTPRELSGEEAVALVAAGRFGELDRYSVFDGIASRDAWVWGFFSALWEFVKQGDPAGLRACARTAESPHEKAAAVAVLAAALVEGGAHDEALAAVDEILALDECSIIDHAWIQLHRARSLVETGDRVAAVELANSVQRLSVLFPEDVTTAALVGSAAALVFRASDVFDVDIARTISAGDNESSWWRAQSTSWGLGSLFDESFRKWAGGGKSVKFFSRDTGGGRLRGVSLVAGFSAMHDAWCHSISTLAKSALMADVEPDNEQVTESLTDLRLAGDGAGIKAAVRVLLESGPALSVARAADLVNLDRATRAVGAASVELIVSGGDVLPQGAADAAARWAMQSPEILSAWAEKVRPSFFLDSKRAELLGAVYRAASPEVANEIRRWITSMPPVVDAGSAQQWARAIDLMSADWSPGQIATLVARDEDLAAFSASVKRLAAERDPAYREQIRSELRAGDYEALSLIREPEHIPIEAVAPLISALSEQIRSRIEHIRHGMFAKYSGVDPADALTWMNARFPAVANWAPILEILTEPLAHKGLIGGAVARLEREAVAIEPPVRERFADALKALVDRPPTPLPILGADHRPACLAALNALTDERHDISRWLSMQTTPARQHMIAGIAEQAEPHHLDVLLALAGDPDPRVRASVGSALTRWAARDGDTEASLAAVHHLISSDLGTLIGWWVVKSVPDRPGGHLRPLLESLSTSISARVRHIARERLRELSLSGAGETGGLEEGTPEG